jgi:hypothetical protein
MFMGSYAPQPTPFTTKQLATCHFLPEQGVLALITRGGDIATWNTGEEDAQVCHEHF